MLASKPRQPLSLEFAVGRVVDLLARPASPLDVEADDPLRSLTPLVRAERAVRRTTLAVVTVRRERLFTIGAEGVPRCFDGGEGSAGHCGIIASCESRCYA